MKIRYKFFIISLLLVSANIANACTIFSCARGGEIFAAANEDDYTPFTRVWFNPQTHERYGSVCFGGADMQVASAMNEYGLFFDFAAASFDQSKIKNKNPYPGFLMWDVLGKCKNVKEALAIINKYDYTSPAKVLLADAEGNSVIISPKESTEKNDNYQVNANCNMINGKLSCLRPDLTNEMLSSTKENSLQFFKNILNKTHQEGRLTTLYSTICDLKRGIVYVYLFHNYDSVYKIDLKAELKKGYRIENLDDHFSSSFAYESFTQNHALYLKESILKEINKNGLDSTIEKYITENGNKEIKDSILNPAILEVALQQIKYAWNEHSNGGMWDYWFSFPTGFNIIPFQDKRLVASSKLLWYLIGQKDFGDNKLNNFLCEMYAYVSLLQGDIVTAKAYYAKSIANPLETYESSYLRAKEMYSRINNSHLNKAE